MCLTFVEVWSTPKYFCEKIWNKLKNDDSVSSTCQIFGLKKCRYGTIYEVDNTLRLPRGWGGGGVPLGKDEKGKKSVPFRCNKMNPWANHLQQLAGVPDPKSYESLKSHTSTASHGSTGSKLSTASSQVSGTPNSREKAGLKTTSLVGLKLVCPRFLFADSSFQQVLVMLIWTHRRPYI